MMNLTPRSPGRRKNPRDLMRISTHIPKEHYEILSEISMDEDLSMAQVIRRAVELYLVSQKDVLGIDDSDMALAAHLSETRSKKAIILNHAEKFHNFNNKDSDVDANSIFEDLNPDAF